MLDRLKNCEGGFWIGDSNGYGCSGMLLCLSEEGISEAGSIDPFCKHVVMTKEQYEEAKEALEDGSYKDIDILILAMMAAECTIGIYYCSNNLFEEWPGYIEETVLVDAWDEMDDTDLEYWCDILDYIEAGFICIDDVGEASPE